MAFPTLLVVELKGTVQLQIVIRITKAAVRIAIPQNTIVLI